MRLSKPLLFVQLACATLLSSNSPVLAVVDGQPVVTATPDATIKLARTVRLAEQRGDGTFGTFCSGVLLDNSTLVTSAQCLFPDRYEASTNGQIFAEIPAGAERKIWSPVSVSSFELGPRMDILAASIVSPAGLSGSLPLADSACDEGSEYSVVGFGVNENRQLPSVPNQTEYKLHHQTGDFSLHLSPTQGRICAADSGAPIFCRVHGKLALAGVVSESSPPIASESKGTFIETCRANDILHATSIKALDQLDKPIPKSTPHEIKLPPQ